MTYGSPFPRYPRTTVAEQDFEAQIERLRDKRNRALKKLAKRHEQALSAVARGVRFPSPPEIAELQQELDEGQVDTEAIRSVRMSILYPRGRDVSLREAWARLDPQIAERLEIQMQEEGELRDKTNALNRYLIYAGDERHTIDAMSGYFELVSEFPEILEREEEPEAEERLMAYVPEELRPPEAEMPMDRVETVAPEYEKFPSVPSFEEVAEEGEKLERAKETLARLPSGEEAPSEMERLFEEAQLPQLGEPLEWVARAGGMALNYPLIPQTAEVQTQWRPPTADEKSRGITMYQPTGAAEKAYEDWVDPGFELPFTTGWDLPWRDTSRMGKKWKVGTKGAAEEYIMIPLWVLGGLGVAKSPQAVREIFEQAIKIQVKKTAGKAITGAENKILQKGVKIQQQMTKQIDEVAPELSKLERMWAEQAILGDATFMEKSAVFWRVIEEKLSDKFAGINKMTARARKQWAKDHPKQPFPIALDAELHAALLGGGADAGIQRAMDTWQKMTRVLGKDISVNYVDDYLHLVHNLDVLAMHPARKVSGGLSGVDGIKLALKQMEDLLGKEAFDTVALASKEVTNHYKQYIMRSVDSGLVSKEVADMLIKKYPNYNPIAYLKKIADHIESGTGQALSVSKNDIKALSEMGSIAARERPLNTLARLSIEKETLIMRNDAANALARLVKNDAQLLEEIARLSPAQRGTLNYMADGTKHSLGVPKWLANEAGLLGQLGFKDLEKVGMKLNAIPRFGMTTANLAFFIPNFAVDSLTAMITYGVGPARLLKRLLFNLKDIIREDKLLASIRRSGGSMSGFWGKTPEEIAADVLKRGQLVLQSKWDFQKIMKSPITLITKIGHAVEMTPRSAVFELELKRGKALEYAALAARRSTIDFQRSGTAIRQANSLWLYLNAGVQGSLIPFRALRDNPRSRYMVAGFLGATIANYAWNRQFPEYEDVPDWAKYGAFPVMLPSQEYDKNGAKVPHYLLVVPNLREWALFSGPLTYAMRKLDQRGSDDFSQFLSEWLSGLNPASQIVGRGGSLIPTQIAQVLNELKENKDSFRNRDIVPEELINLPPAEQYTEWTSYTARKVGELLGYSPLKLEFLVKGVFGGLGAQFLTAFDGVVANIEEQGGDPQTQLYLEQLLAIQETPDPDRIPAMRDDFLESLTPEERDAVLSLEKTPEKRIPIISNILNRVYKERGGQIYQTAKANAKKALDNDKSFETAQDELNIKAEQNALNFMNGLIDGQVYGSLLSDHRQFYRGQMAESWKRREFLGAVMSADVQAYLPEEYQWKAEDLALNTYHQHIDTLFKQLSGVETDENVSRIWEYADAYLDSLPAGIKEYVEVHKNDWINELPPEAQLVQKMRVVDFDYIAETGYWDIPTLNEQRESGVRSPEDLRGKAKEADPLLDATLVFWFPYFTHVKTEEAQAMVAEKAASLGRPLSAIAGYSTVKPMEELKPTERATIATLIQENPDLAGAIKSGNFTADQRRILVALYTKMERKPGTGEAFEEWLSRLKTVLG